MRIWKLIAHDSVPPRKAFDEHVSRGYVGIGWTNVGDLSAAEPTAQADVRALVAKFHPPLSANAFGAPGLWHFFAEMAEGDYVIESGGGRRLGVFRIVGPYEYLSEAERVVGYAHVRRAELTGIDPDALWAALGGEKSIAPGEAVRGTLIELIPTAQAEDLIHQSESSAGMARTRNPAWSRDELILALDLYMQHRSSPLSKDAPQIIELSGVLNSLGDAVGRREAPTYRNANGVYMKLMNFRRFDPNYLAKGKSGLARGNKDEELVWNQFSHDVPALRRVAQLIREGIRLDGLEIDLQGPAEPWLEEAEEGQVLTRVHRFRERDRRLVEAAKASALKTHGRLHCAACGFDFRKQYGRAGEGIIDVHHTRPLHSLQPGEKTRVSELALLCSNCHRLVHSRRRWLSINEVIEALAEGAG